MNILVFVKQVPDTTEIKIDPVTNTLIREGVESILNPFDSYALEAAARIKDDNPDTKIVVASMGPKQAEAALRECLAIAADKAYLLTDRAFGGSDTLATSYILSRATRKIEEIEGLKFDAIFCGKQAIDGDTAQVGPELAEHLGYPQVTCVLTASQQGDELHVLKEAEDGNRVIAIKKPCLITFTKPAFDPRFPTIKRKMAARKAEVTPITAVELSDIDLSRAGLKGSSTRVKKTFVPERKGSSVMIKEASNAESAQKLFRILSEAHVI
ncbi:electron transfer flavoprotein subunit beta/FixA family protein [Lachnospiraceae bacterium ZAX-1]